MGYRVGVRPDYMSGGMKSYLDARGLSGTHDGNFNKDEEPWLSRTIELSSDIGSDYQLHEIRDNPEDYTHLEPFSVLAMMAIRDGFDELTWAKLASTKNTSCHDLRVGNKTYRKLKSKIYVRKNK